MNKLKSKLGLFATTTICLLLVVQSVIYAGSVSEEARRHMARGQAAVEMAKSPDEYDSAINEFQQASRLAPNASDVTKIQEQIYKLEYKAEQMLTVPEIIDVLVSFRGWDTKNNQGCDTSWKQFDLTRQGDNAVNVPTYVARGVSEILVLGSIVTEVTGPVLLKYVTLFNMCSESSFDIKLDKYPDFCFSKKETEIKVVSKTLVKVTSKNLGRGPGVTTCTFEKK